MTKRHLMRNKYFTNVLATKWEEMGFKVFVLLKDRKFHYRIKHPSINIVVDGECFMMQTVKDRLKELYENNRHTAEYSRMGTAEKIQSGSFRRKHNHGEKSILYSLSTLATKT